MGEGTRKKAEYNLGSRRKDPNKRNEIERKGVRNVRRIFLGSNAAEWT